MALMEHVHDPVVVNIFSPIAHLISARGTDGDLFGNRLITIWAEFQGLFSRDTLFQTSGLGGAVVEDEVNVQREALRFVFDVDQTRKWRVVEGQISDDEQFVV
jgi:hypothetical protein